MSNNLTEKRLVKQLLNWFSKQGYFVLESVRIPPKEIDLVLLDPITLKLITIEAKLKNWKKVLSQSLSNKHYSHFSFIAMPTEHYDKIPEHLLRKHGLGFIGISAPNSKNPVTIKTLPEESERINRGFKRELYKKFSEEEIISTHA